MTVLIPAEKLVVTNRVSKIFGDAMGAAGGVVVEVDPGYEPGFIWVRVAHLAHDANTEITSETGRSWYRLAPGETVEV